MLNIPSVTVVLSISMQIWLECLAQNCATRSSPDVLNGTLTVQNLMDARTLQRQDPKLVEHSISPVTRLKNSITTMASGETMRKCIKVQYKKKQEML